MKKEKLIEWINTEYDYAKWKEFIMKANKEKDKYKQDAFLKMYNDHYKQVTLVAVRIALGEEVFGIKLKNE